MECHVVAGQDAPNRHRDKRRPDVHAGKNPIGFCLIIGSNEAVVGMPRSSALADWRAIHSKPSSTSGLSFPPTPASQVRIGRDRIEKQIVADSEPESNLSPQKCSNCGGQGHRA
jgi:hypothetical protein